MAFEKLRMDELNRISAEEYKLKNNGTIVLVLDNVRSAHNVGSVFRTADAFGISFIALCGITASPPNREVLKTALGASDSVNWKHYKTISESIKELQEKGFSVYAIEQAKNSTLLQDFNPSDNQLAFVFGNEVDGVSNEAMEIVNGCIEIPQFGTKHSFNISVTAGIVLWQNYLRGRGRG